MSLDHTDREYALELTKLLWRLAIADGELAPVERRFIESRARADGVPEAILGLFAGQAASQQAIAPPNMEILARHADETRKTAQALVAADGVLNDDEWAALRGLDAALAAYE